MNLKTADEILASNDPNEIHDWFERANIKELRLFLRKVVRADSMGQHARDALDIRIAINNQKIAYYVLALTIIAAICGALAVIFGAIQAFAAVWMMCHPR